MMCKRALTALLFRFGYGMCRGPEHRWSFAEEQGVVVIVDPSTDDALAPFMDGAAESAKVALARNVRAARKERGWTQEILGERSGLGRAVIHRVEKALSNLTIESIAAIARGLELGENGTSMLFSSLNPASASDAEVPREVRKFPAPRMEAMGSTSAARKGHLAIELPAGQAFEAAQLLASHLGRSVTLIDPTTRIVAGIAGRITPE
jgi:transcriptional regulator with XRE-family HTH domain